MSVLIDKDTKALVIDQDDELIQGTMITKDGKVVHPRLADAEAAHLLEHLALMRCITLHRFDEIGDQVIPSFQLHIDLAVGVFKAIPLCHTSVRRIVLRTNVGTVRGVRNRQARRNWAFLAGLG